MNNQSSCSTQSQNSDTLLSLFGPELYPVIAGFQRFASLHPRIDMEGTSIFLSLVRKGEKTISEAVESAEGLAYLTKARLISVAEVGGEAAIMLTETGKKLAAEVMDLFESKAGPLQ